MPANVPWFYRLLLLITALFFVVGAYVDISVLPLHSDSTSPHYARLAKVADLFYDFGNVAFGTLIGGLSALVGLKNANPESPAEDEPAN